MTGTMLEFLLLLIAHAAAGIFSSTLKYSKARTCIIWGIWIVLQGTLLWYTEYVLKNTVLQFFCGFILPLIGQYTIFFATTKGRLALRAFTILTYTVFLSIFMALSVIVKSIFPNMHAVPLALIQAVILLLIMCYYFGYVCPLCRESAKSITRGWRYLIFVSIVFTITVVLFSVFPLQQAISKGLAIITLAFTCISIMTVYPVIFSNINNLSRVATKRAVERQNKLLLAQIEMEKAQLAADSQARHDRRHHNLVMLEFANNNDIEGVRQYLENLVARENEVWGEVRYCDNLTVNTILTVYTKRANENRIPIKVSALVSHDVGVLPQDLVIVIANLFENAIHATEKLKSEDARIGISIKEDTQRLLIKIENTCSVKMVFDDSLYGVGIRSVIATVGKYDGMYDFTAEGGVFSAKVSLNLK